MPHRIYILALVFLTLVIPATARATTIIEPPESHHAYQRWADEAMVPTPDVAVTVSEDLPNCEIPAAIACFFTYPTFSVVVGVFYDADRMAFLHELGHIWDHLVWDEPIRERFLTLINFPPTRAWWDIGEHLPIHAGVELMADSYAVCARLRNFKQGTVYRVGGHLLGPPYMRKVCRLIRHARKWNPDRGATPVVPG